ncbi:hypothetical protein SAMD00079811_78060 (plasmid) [Scytonema sp. HK-05]|nr:hypothetical protein NIES2130_24610 [Scytonema sp. HK-05]BAY50177.1 hypothetical protein SAMD00079811_78060 [Scytonema sp. HK-05]
MVCPEFGRKMIRYMKSKGWRIRPLNIVYLEDANPDTWQPTQGKLDEWDDVRIVVSDKGEVLLSCEATCEPGTYYTYNPMNPAGAFRIANDIQFLDAWEFGYHHNQEALVQCGTIIGFRDGNKDGIRVGDAKVQGDDFCVNQHTTGDSPDASAPDKVGRWSAGCLVGRYPSTHYGKFLPLCRQMSLKKFDTAIIPSDSFAEFS